MSNENADVSGGGGTSVDAMATSDPDGEVSDRSNVYDPPLPASVDWIVGVVVAFGGLLLTVGGTVLVFAVDRALIADGIDSGDVSLSGLVERDLTRAEMTDFVLAVVDWAGIGLLVTGLGLVLFAIGYVVVRHRAHSRSERGPAPGTVRTNAVVGAATSAVLSFVPFSPVLGGGLAGYVGHEETGRTTSVGALSGFLYVLPGLVLLLFLTIGLYTGLSGVGESGVGLVLVPSMLVVLLFAAAYGGGLGALGGYLGGRLADDGD